VADLRVNELYPARTDPSGVTWYRPAFAGLSPPSPWGWTSDPAQAHEDYSDAELPALHPRLPLPDVDPETRNFMECL
jgi:hypothetical protein